MRLKGELSKLSELSKRRDQNAILRSAIFRIFAYPAFLLHLLLFGGLGFVMAYGDVGVSPIFLYAHGLFAVTFFLPLYRSMFGPDEMKWTLINVGLGIFGICSEMDWLVSFIGAGKTLSSYPFYLHPVPFLYYIMYTFLIRQVVLDLTGAREQVARRKVVEHSYLALSLLAHASFYFLK